MENSEIYPQQTQQLYEAAFAVTESMETAAVADRESAAGELESALAIRKTVPLNRRFMTFFTVC